MNDNVFHQVKSHAVLLEYYKLFFSIFTITLRLMNLL